MSIKVEAETIAFAKSFTSEDVVKPQIDGNIAYIPVEPGKKACIRFPNDKIVCIAVSKNSKMIFDREYYGVIVVETIGGVMPGMNACLVCAKALAIPEVNSTIYVVGSEPHLIYVCDYEDGESDLTNINHRLFAENPKKFNQKMKKYKEAFHLFRMDEDGKLVF